MTDASNDRILDVAAPVIGWACVLIGVYHFALGNASVPGATTAGPTVDSRERFYSAIFAGYGAAWVRAARQPRPVGEVRALSALMLAGGVGRLVSLVQHGRPHWFQNVLTAVEFGLPTALLALTRERSPLGDEAPRR